MTRTFFVLLASAMLAGAVLGAVQAPSVEAAKAVLGAAAFAAAVWAWGNPVRARRAAARGLIALATLPYRAARHALRA